ncbi:MAG: DUF368 domain-containing protein [Planctomycetota bacterium]
MDSSRQMLLHVFRGFLMGGADVIPGVSGGTVALILGIYKRLVKAVSSVDAKLFKRALQLNWRAVVFQLDLTLVVPLAVGIVVGAFALAGVIEWLLTEKRQDTFAAFFGLIAGSTILVGRMVPKWDGVRIAAAAVAAVAAFVLVGLDTLQNPPGGPLYLFVCGAIAITAMILPGISGSYMLLVLGAYDRILEMVHVVKDALKSVSLPPTAMLVELAAFAGGLVIGILSFSKLLKWLLEKKTATTLAVLTGLMVGSLRRLWPFQTDLTPEIEKLSFKRYAFELPDFAAGTTWMTLGWAVAGFVFVLALERLAGGRTAKP